ncbi:hypothetical protein GCM10019016_036060 [Streptomyces prasinosporus]|uniref:Uncharacterized protein n=1 Tax=Streptomyces prasinosporus TaxID=68256 RepID=A0ABP6TP08_9ACTN
MTEVEDVALEARGLLQHLARLGLDGLAAGEQHGRVEVALERLAGADAAGGLAQRDAPVDAHDVRAGLAHRAEELAGAHAEVDARDAVPGDRAEHLRRGGQHRAPVVGRGERAGPGVEQLDRRGAGLDLDLEERGGDVREAVEQVGPQLGVAVHHRLGVLVRAGRAALDQVAREGERGAREADQRGGPELTGQQADRLGDVGDVLGGQVAQPGEVGAGAHRLLDDRADAGLDVEVDADGLEGDDDVAEVDRRVDLVAAHRLERDLGDQIGAHAGLQHPDALAHLAVLRQ